MSIQATHAKIKANIWQAIAQSGEDVAGIPREKLENLVNLAAEAALIEMNNQLNQTLSQSKPASSPEFNDIEEEIILWEGRPFLSISRRYIITDDRVRIIDGLFSKSFQNIELIRIQDMEHSQSMSERMLNVGDITIFAHDRSDATLILDNIQEPEAVHEILRKAVLKARQKHNFSYRQEM